MTQVPPSQLFRERMAERSRSGVYDAKRRLRKVAAAPRKNSAQSSQHLPTSIPGLPPIVQKGVGYVSQHPFAIMSAAAAVVGVLGFRRSYRGAAALIKGGLRVAALSGVVSQITSTQKHTRPGH